MKKSTICGIIISIIIFTAVVTVITTISGLPINTDNAWIGYWGSVLGNLITLFVLYFTLKSGDENLSKTLEFEKMRDQEESRQRFNDELLNCLIEYHTLMQAIFGDLSQKTSSKDFMDKAHRSTVLSKIIMIKIESKLNNSKYSGIEQLLKSFESVTQNFNDLIELKNNELNGEEVPDMRNKEKIVGKCIDALLVEIELYYTKNED